MSEILERMEDLWDIVLDLLTFYHRCCYNCMPFEGGEPVWLSESCDLSQELQEIAYSVAQLHGVEIDDIVDEDEDAIAKAFDEQPTNCPNCGTEWESGTEIGGEWLVTEGTDTRGATHLLTKAFWPYLSHYTRGAGGRSGFDVLQTILEDGVIRGSSRFILDGRSVVALSECSPLEVMELLRTQRIPARRGDRFQWRRSQHGIAIRRSAAIAYGARPAIHAETRILDLIPGDDRFRCVTWDPDPANPKDWTFEREFRVEGDIELSSLDPSSVIVIVADRAERFQMLAQRDITPFAVMPFDYVFSEEAMGPHISRRQQEKRARR